jgi:uncharacterized membrane protein YbhN (UPF0104 family)
MDRLKPIIRWMVGIGLVALLLVRFDLGAVLQHISRTNPWLLVPALGGLVAVHLLGALAWWLIDARLNHEWMPWRHALRTYYVAQGIGGMTPANLGSDAYRLYAAGSSGWRRGLAPIVLQRVTSAAALAALGLLALAWLPAGSPYVTPAAVAAIAGLALTIPIVLVINRRPRRDAGVLADGAHVGERRRAGDLTAGSLIGLGLGLAFHAASLGLALVVLAAVAPIPAPLPALACLAIARLAILVPISPSGLGIQEGALALLFPTIGLPVELGLAAALLNRLALVLVAALGGTLLAWPRVRAMSARRHGNALPPHLVEGRYVRSNIRLGDPRSRHWHASAAAANRPARVRADPARAAPGRRSRMDGT